MDKLLYQLIVSGRVQGVWFRKYTLDKARSLGIKGFARNENDGSVYIEAEGTSKQLDEFIKWLYTGSPLSRVNEVQYDLSELKNYSSFEIGN